MIQRSNPWQCQVNLEILNFVNQRGRASAAELLAAFADPGKCEVKAKKALTKKLDYLVYTQQLQANKGYGCGVKRYFTLGVMAGKRHPGAAAPDAAPEPDLAYLKYAGPLVPPRQLDVMHAPVYVPGPSTALRPGSLDYQRYASFGQSC